MSLRNANYMCGHAQPTSFLLQTKIFSDEPSETDTLTLFLLQNVHLATRNQFSKTFILAVYKPGH